MTQVCAFHADQHLALQQTSATEQAQLKNELLHLKQKAEQAQKSAEQSSTELQALSNAYSDLEAHAFSLEGQLREASHHPNASKSDAGKLVPCTPFVVPGVLLLRLSLPEHIQHLLQSCWGCCIGGASAQGIWTSSMFGLCGYTLL